MADLQIIHDRTGVALRTLRKLERAGYLKSTSAKDPLADGMAITLAKGNSLNTLQMLHAFRNEELQDRFNLHEAMHLLGDVNADAASWGPNGLANRIGDKDAIEPVAKWCVALLDRLPDGKLVNHAYLGVRLLANVPDNFVHDMMKRLRVCMWNVKLHPIMQGYSSTTEKKKTFYHRKITLDL